jgi:hypothetical protein
MLRVIYKSALAGSAVNDVARFALEGKYSNENNLKVIVTL